MLVQVILIERIEDLAIVSYNTVKYIVGWDELTHIEGDIYQIERRNLSIARIMI